MSTNNNRELLEIKEEYLTFLDELRESGVINMFGAAPYLSSRFKLSIDNSRKILSYWMETFSERHKND